MDSITIADGPETEPGPPALSFPVDAARQFREGGRYLFSVEVFASGGGQPVALTLLGYDRL